MKPELLPSARLLLVLLALLVSTGMSPAQGLRLTQSLPLPQSQAVAIDRLGQVYVTDQKNNLLKLSPQGKRLFTFSPASQGHLAAVDAWNPVKTLLFYDDRQQVILLDRFLAPITTIHLADLTDGLVRLATLAPDDQLWILNERDFSLSKIDPRRPDAHLQSPLNQILQQAPYDFRLLREYQNNVYLLDRNTGIYIFDNMGNFKKKVPVTGLDYLGFAGEEGYYLKNGQLTFLNLYTGQERTLSLPPGKPYRQALVGDNVLYLLSPASLDIYQLEN